MDKTSLGDRMKQYEQCNSPSLPIKLPMIVRIDGKNFSKFTKKMDKPYDVSFHELMKKTCSFLVKNLQDCVLSYSQSDEISLLFMDSISDKDNTGWFGRKKSKIESLTAAYTTAEFSKHFILEKIKKGENIENLKMPVFDSRAFVIPFSEVANYFVWRQRDAEKNSITNICYWGLRQDKNLGRKTALSLMHKKNGNEKQELLFQEIGKNWNDFPTWQKRGFCCYKVLTELENENGKYTRNIVNIDEEIPIFSKKRDFIGKFLEKSL